MRSVEEGVTLCCGVDCGHGKVARKWARWRIRKVEVEF